MILPDLNLVIYAYDSSSPFHPGARKWWIETLSGSESVAIPWAVVFGFVRLWTSPKVFANPMTVQLATSHVEAWFKRPMVRALNPGPLHLETVFGLLRAEGQGGNLTTDAHLAALAIESGATLHTNDTDFHRFSGLKTVNPLQLP